MAAYDRVKEILELSVGNNGIGAHGNFWRAMSKDEFLDASIFGHSLITKWDGSSSNLVKSLRGESPFGSDIGTDGSIFRRMPSQLPPVSQSEINYISAWIDNECPDEFDIDIDEPDSGKVDVVFYTTRFAPSNRVSLHVSFPITRAGGSRLEGSYSGGAWRFSVPVGEESVGAHFILNERYAQRKGSFCISRAQQLIEHDETTVEFFDVRTSHRFENLVTERNYTERTYIPKRQPKDACYDAIVIGSGMGGGIFADAASDAGLKTLVIEAGSVLHATHLSNLPVPSNVHFVKSFVNYPGTNLTGDVCVNFGGRSVFWGGVIPRMSDWELQHWPESIRSYLLSEGYDKAELLFRKRQQHTDTQEQLLLKIKDAFTGFDCMHLPRAVHLRDSPLIERKGESDEMPTGVFSTAALLLNSLTVDGAAGKENLFIRLHTVANAIKQKRHGFASVLCTDLIEGSEVEYLGKIIVLAAGATESPGILLRSDMERLSERTGIGLTDHQHAELIFSVPEDFPYLSHVDQAKYLLRPVHTGLDDSFNCEFILNWKYWDARHADDDVWNQLFLNNKETRSTLKILFRSGLNNNNFVRVRNGTVEVRVENMADRPLEKEAEAMKIAALEFFGVPNTTLRKQKLKYKQEPNSFHLSGSLRIGKNAKHGVVDDDLRLHGYENVYVCDLSMFPDVPAANPCLTLGALALRLADHLRHKL